MIRYPVTIELLSETTFGNGESKNGVVNTEVLLDKNGLPYFLGKTFKGYLRNAIDTILKPYYKNDKNFEESLIDLFGSYKNGDSKKDFYGKIFKQQEGKIKFTNFYLHKDIADVILSCNNENMRIALLTDIRFAIKIEDGVSKDKSLRASRVLKKGLVFTGYIESEKSISNEEYEFLKEGISALKNLGVNKSRGKGLVKVQMDKVEEDNLQEYGNKGVEIEDKDFNYIFYELRLKEPVKIGDSQSKYDYEESKLYVTGSSIRGSVINKIVKNYEDLDITDILKKAYFYDAYPIYIKGNKQCFSFPTPNIFRISKERDKDENKIYEKGKSGYSVVFDKNENDDRKVVKLKKGSFSYYDGDKLCQFDVKKDYRFHHSQQIEKENIFRYESISKGQKFYGVIDVSKLDTEFKKIIIKLMKERPVIYLGGSRTGGYGKTEVSSSETIETFSKLQEKLTFLKPSKCNRKYTDIYFLSDTILRDERHQITSSFPEEYLKDMLDVNVKDKIKYDVAPAIITGFNTKWQSNLPQVYGIEKGSILRIIDSGKLEDKKILKFIKVQHGDRKQDGLGRVIINPDFLNAKYIEFVNTELIEDKEQYSSSNITEVSKDVLQYIKDNMKNYITDKYVKEYVLKAKKEFNLNNSKINDVISIIDECVKSEDNNFQKFRNQILNLEEVSQNEERNIVNSELLDNVSIEECSLREIIYLEKNEREQLIGKIIPQEVSIDNSADLTLLNIIRGILYYKQKEKKLEVGEANVHQGE